MIHGAEALSAAASPFILLIRVSHSEIVQPLPRAVTCQRTLRIGSFQLVTVQKYFDGKCRGRSDYSNSAQSQRSLDPKSQGVKEKTPSPSTSKVRKLGKNAEDYIKSHRPCACEEVERPSQSVPR